MRLRAGKERAAAAAAAAAKHRRRASTRIARYGHGRETRARAARVSLLERESEARSEARLMRGASSGSRRVAAPRPREGAREHSRARWDHQRGSSRARRGAARRGRARGRDRVDARPVVTRGEIPCRSATRPSSTASSAAREMRHLAWEREQHPSAREGTRRGVALGVGARADHSRARRAHREPYAPEGRCEARVVGARRDHQREEQGARGAGGDGTPVGREVAPRVRQSAGVAGLSERENRRERVERARTRPSSTTGATFRFRARTRRCCTPQTSRSRLAG